MAELSEVLGYPVSTATLARRLESVLQRREEAVLVAELAEAEIVGWVHGSEQEFLQAGPRCEILGLVVAVDHRRQGVGRELVLAVERWARSRGLDEMGVRSAATREEAHPFYQRLGYVCTKTQQVYRKKLGAPG